MSKPDPFLVVKVRRPKGKTLPIEEYSAAHMTWMPVTLMVEEALETGKTMSFKDTGKTGWNSRDDLAYEYALVPLYDHFGEPPDDEEEDDDD
jgi:hypothetical protein